MHKITINYHCNRHLPSPHGHQYMAAMFVILVDKYVYPKTMSSFRSHDGFTTDGKGIMEPSGGSKYASQRMVFNDLGQGVLDNAFDGTYKG